MNSDWVSSFLTVDAMTADLSRLLSEHNMVFKTRTNDGMMEMSYTTSRITVLNFHKQF